MSRCVGDLEEFIATIITNYDLFEEHITYLHIGWDSPPTSYNEPCPSLSAKRFRTNILDDVLPITIYKEEEC